MLELTFPSIESYDESRNEFVDIPEETCIFMFNLLALDKWEGIYKKRLLDNSDITVDEYLHFFEIMCVEGKFDRNRVGKEEYNTIMKYISETKTATVLPKPKSKPGERKKVLTSEIIYAYMCISGIPLEWEKRNLNKLLMLISTISSVQQPPEKMTKEEAMAEQSRLIAERRKKYEH